MEGKHQPTPAVTVSEAEASRQEQYALRNGAVGGRIDSTKREDSMTQSKYSAQEILGLALFSLDALDRGELAEVSQRIDEVTGTATKCAQQPSAEAIRECLSTRLKALYRD